VTLGLFPSIIDKAHDSPILLLLLLLLQNPIFTTRAFPTQIASQLPTTEIQSPPRNLKISEAKTDSSMINIRSRLNSAISNPNLAATALRPPALRATARLRSEACRDKPMQR
jgi:hypothetical protein